MKTRLRFNQDVAAGVLFIAIGVAGLWLGRTYPVGTAFRMGPGYFPTMLCGLLTLFGVGIALRGLIVGGIPVPRWQLRPLGMVVLALLTFALTVTNLGLVPAALLLVVLAAFGGPAFRLSEAVLLAIGLTAVATALFAWALELPLHPINF